MRKQCKHNISESRAPHNFLKIEFIVVIMFLLVLLTMFLDTQMWPQIDQKGTPGTPKSKTPYTIQGHLAFLAHFGALLGQLWVTMAPLCVTWGPLWVTLEPLWASLGTTWAHYGWPAGFLLPFCTLVSSASISQWLGFPQLLSDPLPALWLQD